MLGASQLPSAENTVSYLSRFCPSAMLIRW